MEIQQYADSLAAAYVDHGILLSDAQLNLLSNSSIERSDLLEKLIKISREQLDRDLELQIATLAEAEAARDHAIQLKSEAEVAKIMAEASGAKLADANEQLAKRQAATEEVLQHETTFRLNSQKTDFQRNFAIIMAILVGVALLLPYFSGWLNVGDKITDHTANLSLLLIQTLGIIAGSLFQSNRKDQNSGN